MKKIYVNPAINVMKIETIQMIASSTQTMGVKGNYGSGVTLGSRQASQWDDDDEE